MDKEFEIDGIITVPEGVTQDQLTDEFVEWAASKGYTFGGKIVAVEDD